MVSTRSLLATLLVGQALATPVLDVITVTKYVEPAEPTTFELNPGQYFEVNPNVHLDKRDLIDKRIIITTTTSSSSTSRATVSITETETVYSTTVTVTVPPGGASTTTTTSSTTPAITTSSSSSTTTGTTTTSSSTTSSTSSCPTTLYKIQASGTGDFSVDGNYAQLVSVIGPLMSIDFISNFQNAQQYRLGGPDCTTLQTADGSLQALVGGDDNTNLANVFFYSSPQAAHNFINANFAALVCMINADETLTCTGDGKSILQTAPNRQNLQIGDRRYGNVATLNLTPVPGSTFKN